MNNNKPYLIIIQPTPFCNIDCRYCYLPNRISKNRITSETLRKIFSRLFEENLVTDQTSIVWHAGEPLVMPIEFYRDAFEILQQENNLHLKVGNHFQTNATLITQTWCDFIKQQRMRIGVSLDGPKFIHDLNRVDRQGKGSFNRVMRGISLLHDNQITFSVIMVLTHYALDYPEEIFNFFLDNGITNFAFNIEEQEGINLITSLKDSSAEKYEAFFRVILRLQEQHPNVRIREIDHMRNAILYAENMRSETNAPLRIINFDYKGNFSTFCPELLTMNHPNYGDFILGNVWQNKISELWQNQKFTRMYNEIQAGVEKCSRDCEYFSVCGGGKPVNKLCENQTFDSTATNYCKLRIMSLANVLVDHLEQKYQTQTN